jgi:hypothetical protein
MNQIFNATNKIEVLSDGAVHSEHELIIRCDIGVKPVERSELDCVMW